MSLPGNGIYVVHGEMSTIMTAMRRNNNRWNSSTYADDEKDGVMKLFVDLKQILNRIEDLRLIDPNIYLTPFLEVIRTDETTSIVTGLAIASINKFLSYGLIDPTLPNLPVIVENIADAVTHARFMGTDQASNGLTLFRVVEVLHTLMRSPEGSALTNEAVCEIMLSCFKICFESRLDELLWRYAEQALRDMVLLLFMRLPQFAEDRSESGFMRKFQMMAAASMENEKQKQKKQANKHQLNNNNNNNNNNSNNHNSMKRSNSSSAKMEDGSAVDPQTPQNPGLQVEKLKVEEPTLSTTPATPAGNILDMQGKIIETPTTTTTTTTMRTSTSEAIEQTDVPAIQIDETPLPAQEPVSPEPNTNNLALTNNNMQGSSGSSELEAGSNEYINSMGVRFTQQNSIDGSEGLMPLIPYGLPCIQELFRFLIMLCNPLDKQNTDTMIHMGLNLLTVAFEVGADNIGKYDTLLELVKDDLCRHLIALFKTERVSIFAADLQLCFLIFESLRGHLKLQMESYLRNLSEIIANDNPKTPYEVRELALDNLRQLCRIPGFVAELYINYDCDLYCSDMFEYLTNLLSKHTLSATNAIYSTHILALETLLSIIDNIENNCIAAKNNATVENPNPSAHSHRHSRHNSGLDGIVLDPQQQLQQQHQQDEPKVVIENISKYLNTNTNSQRYRYINAAQQQSVTLTSEQLVELKQKKRVLSQGTELFNQRPDKGIAYLQENGIFKQPLDPKEVAVFLRENPGLDKKMIGEYISKKKNVDSKILMNFVESFDFTGLRVDQALRLYLETFRLPGEAPLIFLVLEHFADHWHKQNGEPFDNADSAFRLAYAIIMLNMDQHNTVAKRLNIPMTPEDFQKNLRGLNGNKDFDQDMLLQIFNAIKNEEIIMPAEQTGVVRDNYLWKVLLRRGLTADGNFHYVEDASYDHDIFRILWGPSISALTFMFDRSTDTGYQRTLNGFMKFAGISAHYEQHEDFDAIILTLCKFSTLFNYLPSDGANGTGSNGSLALNAPHPQHQYNEIIQAANFGANPKAQAAMKTVFLLVHDYGDCLREGWKNILDIFLQLFKLKLLPKSLIEVEDFCEETGKALLILEKLSQKQEAGLFSSLYSYLSSSEGQKEPTYEEQEYIKIGKKCIKECQLDQMIQETKFLQLESLQELLKAVLALMKAPSAHKSIGLPYSEDIVVFWMEFLVKVVIHNRDRMIQLWPNVRNQMYLLLMGSSSCGYDYLLHRCIVAILKLAIYLMRNEELCPFVLQSLKMLLILKSSVLYRISKQISIGIFELLKTSAQNIHTEQDWQIIFSILECVGAGAVPPEIDDASIPIPNGNSARSEEAVSSEDDSGLAEKEQHYHSDSEISAKAAAAHNLQHQMKSASSTTTSNSSPRPSASASASSPTTENWILVNKDSEITTMSRPQSPPSSVYTLSSATLSSLSYDCKLVEHSPFALFKCWDSLVFIVRNVAHITPYNFESCVRCIRTFVEASRNGGYKLKHKYEERHQARNQASAGGTLKKKTNKRHDAHKESQRHHQHHQQHQQQHHQYPNYHQYLNHLTPLDFNSDNPHLTNNNQEDEDSLKQRYETLSIQLLDLMYTLYTRTAQIFRWWAEEDSAIPQCSALWAQGWCPLLQGIARLATDCRREVRTYAISCLQQRALLVHDLQTLTGSEWSSCFQQVLFPLLNEHLPDSHSIAFLDSMLLEESRIRTATIMSKVFLHHLTPLIELGAAFNDLWLEILNYIEKFMKVGSDMLSEQMQEILKNMLLVMHSVRVFHGNDDVHSGDSGNSSSSTYLPLWELTWQRIGLFLPKLKEELFRRDEGPRRTQLDYKSAVSINPPSVPAPSVSPGPNVPEANLQTHQNQPAAAPAQPIPTATATYPSPAVPILPVTALTSPVELPFLAKSPLQSPYESPRHSIILQAAEMHGGSSINGPGGNPLLLNQMSSLGHSMPILVPPTSPPTSPIPMQYSLQQQQLPQQLQHQQSMPSLVQPIAQLPHAATSPALTLESNQPLVNETTTTSPSAALPDLLSDAQSTSSADQTQATTINEETQVTVAATEYASFVMDFPSNSEEEQRDGQQQQQSGNELNFGHLNEYYQQMHLQQHSQENQQQQEQQEQQQPQQQQHLPQLHQHFQEMTIQSQQQRHAEHYLAHYNNNHHQQHYQNEFHLVQQQQQQQHAQFHAANATPETLTPAPSSATTVPINQQYATLAQSFSPSHYQQSHGETLVGGLMMGGAANLTTSLASSPFEADIYQEYIQNPYNLKMQQQDFLSNERHQQEQQQQQQHQQQQRVEEVPSPNPMANYFTNNQTENSVIPPGSEILFGQQT